MGCISLCLYKQQNKVHGPKKELFSKRKSLPVLKKIPTVDFVDELHRLPVLRQLKTSDNAAIVTIQSSAWNPIPVHLI